MVQMSCSISEFGNDHSTHIVCCVDPLSQFRLASTMETPDSFTDATFGMEIMRDPVSTPEGHTFERGDIEEWIRVNGSCPLTRNPLSTSDLVPNRSLRYVKVLQRVTVFYWKGRNSRLYYVLTCPQEFVPNYAYAHLLYINWAGYFFESLDSTHTMHIGTLSLNSSWQTVVLKLSLRGYKPPAKSCNAKSIMACLSQRTRFSGTLTLLIGQSCSTQSQPAMARFMIART